MYIDAYHDKATDKIKIVHRTKGQRTYAEYPAVYEFYYPDPRGKYRSVDGKTLNKYSSNSKKKFQKELMSVSGSKYESDIDPIFKILEQHYSSDEYPDLHVAFFDIEVNYDQERGYSSPMDPFNEINAISVYLSWLDELHTFVVKPQEISWAQAAQITAKFPNCKLCENEKEILTNFLKIIEDADLLSGWNSQFFDLPYIIRRIEIALSREYSRELCLWNQLPRKGSVLRFKKEHLTYSLVGRVHLDYLDLYRKHTPSVKHTYKLDYIGEIEVGENKIPYDGSLDALYRFDFEKFIAYNRQDTELIAKIDKKLKYINVSNLLVHSNGVLFKNILGSVAMIDQAIIRKAHQRGLRIPDRRDRNSWESEEPTDLDLDEDEDSNKVAGAYVQKPKIGFHRWIGGLDINSLYPSAIRALNIAPETLFGQIRPLLTEQYLKQTLENNPRYTYADAWANLFSTIEYEQVIARTDQILTIDFYDQNNPEGKAVEMTARQLYDIVFSHNSNLIISANGTIFRKDVEGVLPGLLSEWFHGRRIMQARAKNFGSQANGLKISNELVDILIKNCAEIIFSESTNSFENKDVDKNINKNIDIDSIQYDFLQLKAIVQSIDINDLQSLKTLTDFIQNNNLKIRGNTIVSIYESQLSAQYEYWDRQQYLRKILLNSAYGALLNQYSRFFDQRLGQSVTLTGRCIVRHMGSFVNEQFEGVYEIGDANIYGDTDSVNCHSIIDAMTVNKTKMTIEQLFDTCTIKWRDGEKEYSVDDKIKVLSYNAETQQPQYYGINYVYRHKVSKARYQIQDELGNVIDVTEDHSIMIERDGVLQEVKPCDVRETDLLISME